MVNRSDLPFCFNDSVPCKLNLWTGQVLGNGQVLGMVRSGDWSGFGTGQVLGMVRFGDGQVLGMVRFGDGQVWGLVRFGDGQVWGLVRLGDWSGLGMVRFGDWSGLGMVRFGDGQSSVWQLEFLRALGSQSGVSVWQHTLVG